MNKKNIDKFNKAYLGLICHRGFHDEKATENGLKAFQNAIDMGLPFELDIHITKDKKLVVCHDSQLKRTTSKGGIIEDLTLEEIKNNYRLVDGSQIPTFEEVLSLNKGRSLIVVELKVYNRNYKELAKATNEVLMKIEDKKSLVLISFDPRALIRVKRSGFPTGLLICKSHYYVWMTRYLFDSVDIEECLLKDKKVQRYRKKHLVNVWTIEKQEDLDSVLDFADAYTFQGFIPKNFKKKDS